MPTKPEILDAAVRLFACHGYRGTTLSEIAAEVGISQPALYYYYKNKQHILGEVARLYEEQLEQQQACVFDLAIAPGEKLAMVAHNWTEFVAEHSAILDIVVRERGEMSSSDRESVIGKERGMLQKIADVYEEGVCTGVFPSAPPKIVALLFAGMCNSVRHWYHPGGDLDTEQLATLTSHVLLHGLAGARSVARDVAVSSRA